MKQMLATDSLIIYQSKQLMLCAYKLANVNIRNDAKKQKRNFYNLM